jgi:GNAT superfamily N-acetyltransferase
LDAEEGATLLRRSITDLCSMDHGGDASAIDAWTANKTSRWWISWLGTQPFFYIVEDRDLLAGVCLMSSAGEILLNYVHPDFRFCGVSKMMLCERENAARRTTMSALRVSSTRTAYRFYTAAGFVEVATGKPQLLQKPLNPFGTQGKGPSALRHRTPR